METLCHEVIQPSWLRPLSLRLFSPQGSKWRRLRVRCTSGGRWLPWWHGLFQVATCVHRYATTSVHPHCVLAVRVDLDYSTRLAPCLGSLVLDPNTGSRPQAASSTVLACALPSYLFMTLGHLSLPLFQGLLPLLIDSVVLFGHGDSILQLSVCR
ncbi:hypothetical protein E2C01_026895 [Portunus trituberculatus]|uniref:Uncharacterized protein n=1 Tax=Portunus trituberculatus TaxID=210409 RepID=A0A5B7EGI1_PORTR|nr:hypothetical protein [Portunus trituberculatus]